MRKLLETPVTYCVIGVLLALFQPIRAGWWGLLVLGALICLYAFLAKGERTAERSTAGDNSYIIGFVYTLSIITLSLVFDAESLLGTGDQSGDLHPLLRTIGIALGTSVVGMFCRFCLTHGIEIAEDAFDRAVGRTAVAAAKLEAVVEQLGSAVEGLKPITDNIGHTMEQNASAISTYARRVDAESDKAGDLLAQAAERVLKGAELRVAETLDELSLSVKSLSDGMTKDLQSAVASVRQTLTEVSEAIQGCTATMESETRSAGEALNRSVAAINDLVQRAARALQENVFDEFRTAVSALVHEQTKAVRENAQLLATGLGGLNQEMRTAVATHRTAVVDTGASLSSGVDDLKRQVDASVAIAEEIRTLTASWRSVVDSEAWSAMERAMRQFTANVESLRVTLEAVADHQSKAVSGAEEHAERLRQATAVCNELMRELRSDIAGISDLKERYRKEFDQAAAVALEETHRLYARLIGGATAALSGVDELDTFVRDLRLIAERISRDDAILPSMREGG